MKFTFHPRVPSADESVFAFLEFPLSTVKFLPRSFMPGNLISPKRSSNSVHRFWHFCGFPSQKFSFRKTPLRA
ncbi:hypothetical protein DDT91_07990 [Algoriphagus sp. AK58]|nr:hypothetical protein [Algoriphagus sp. AK58]